MLFSPTDGWKDDSRNAVVSGVNAHQVSRVKIAATRELH